MQGDDMTIKKDLKRLIRQRRAATGRSSTRQLESTCCRRDPRSVSPTGDCLSACSHCRGRSQQRPRALPSGKAPAASRRERRARRSAQACSPLWCHRQPEQPTERLVNDPRRHGRFARRNAHPCCRTRRQGGSQAVYEAIGQLLGVPPSTGRASRPGPIGGPNARPDRPPSPAAPRRPPARLELGRAAKQAAEGPSARPPRRQSRRRPRSSPRRSSSRAACFAPCSPGAAYPPPIATTCSRSTSSAPSWPCGSVENQAG